MSVLERLTMAQLVVPAHVRARIAQGLADLARITQHAFELQRARLLASAVVAPQHSSSTVQQQQHHSSTARQQHGSSTAQQQHGSSMVQQQQQGSSHMTAEGTKGIGMGRGGAQIRGLPRAVRGGARGVGGSGGPGRQWGRGSHRGERSERRKQLSSSLDHGGSDSEDSYRPSGSSSSLAWTSVDWSDSDSDRTVELSLR